jgi:hypothetical protein
LALAATGHVGRDMRGNLARVQVAVLVRNPRVRQELRARGQPLYRRT